MVPSSALATVLVEESRVDSVRGVGKSLDLVTVTPAQALERYFDSGRNKIKQFFKQYFFFFKLQFIIYAVYSFFMTSQTNAK